MNDPIEKAEEIIKETQREAGKLTHPVLKRYPLLFSFLTVFSIAAILHGFEIWADSVSLFHENPSILILIGIAALLFTGSLYKTLEKMK